MSFIDEDTEAQRLNKSTHLPATTTALVVSCLAGIRTPCCSGSQLSVLPWHRPSSRGGRLLHSPAPFSSFSSPGQPPPTSFLSLETLLLFSNVPWGLEFEFQALIKVPSCFQVADRFAPKLFMTVQEQKLILLVSVKRAHGWLFSALFPWKTRGEGGQMMSFLILQG